MPEWGEKESVIEGVCALIGRAMAHPWSAESVRSALDSDRACLVWEEDEAARVIGCVVGRRVAVDLVEVDLVAVDPEWRREGRGRRLLRELIAVEREGGVREFRLELSADNVGARALYEGVGFVVVGRRARYYPDGEDALLLTWTVRDGTGAEGSDHRRGH